jgi:hypothetical protein
VREGSSTDNHSEPGAYADALPFPPWIADERDGTLFRNLPAARFKCPLNPFEGGADTDASAFAPDLHAPFHSSTDTDERQHDHER